MVLEGKIELIQRGTILIEQQLREREFSDAGRRLSKETILVYVKIADANAILSTRELLKSCNSLNSKISDFACIQKTNKTQSFFDFSPRNGTCFLERDGGN